MPANVQRRTSRNRGRSLRSADLARHAGVSAQQIRNYLDEGLLPPAIRSPGGHRLYGSDHLRALTLARQLALGHGWTRARGIMNAIHNGRPDDAIAIIDDSHSELARERCQLHDILAAVAALTIPTATPHAPHEHLSIGEIAHRAAVKRSALRVWERQGLLRPGREDYTGYRTYSPTDLRDAHLIVLLRRGGYRHPAIKIILDELKAVGNTTRVQAALAGREADLAERARTRLAATAALHDYLQSRPDRQE